MVRWGTTRRADLAGRGIHFSRTHQPFAERARSGYLVRQDLLEMSFEGAILADEIRKIAVEEPILPDDLEQQVKK